jgi:hypothetical protein
VTRLLCAPLLLICCAGPPAAQGPALPDLPLSESGRDAATYRLYGSDPAAAALYASFHAAAVEPPHKAEPAPAPAPPAPGLTVDGKYTLTVTEMPFRVLAPTGADLYFWRVPAAWTAADDGATLTVTAAPAGAATVGLQTVTIDWAGKKTVRGNYSLSVAVGGTPPPQPPGPGPQPPGPGPTPNPTTEPTVLIVYETAELSKLPRAQLDALYDKQTRDWLDRKAPARWRIWDANVPTANAPPAFQALMQRPRQSLPWLVVAGPDGKPAFEGPLPADAARLLATLQQYGGQ